MKENGGKVRRKKVMEIIKGADMGAIADADVDTKEDSCTRGNGDEVRSKVVLVVEELSQMSWTLNLGIMPLLGPQSWL